MEQKPLQTVDTVLIASVGRTLEPLEATLANHAPEAAILIASEDTMGTAAQLREGYPEVSFKTLLLDDPENLTGSFRLARKALAMAKSMEARAIFVDITGGTKPMTAGLVLALSGLGVTFSYVGGQQRDPETGRVLSGSERIVELEDPTERFHEAEWRAYKQAWNAWRMDTAADILRRLLANSPALSPSEHRFFKHLLGVTLGMASWDRFHHAEALEHLENNISVALAIAEAWRHGAKVRVLGSLESQLTSLSHMAKSSRKPTRGLLEDLLANAERRAEAGRYDDALARLYRAIELAAEADLYERTGIVLREPDTWKDADLKNKYGERASQLLGLFSVLDIIFDIDVHLGNKGTLAQKLRSEMQNQRALLQKRHKSILAHGTEAVHKEDYLEFKKVFETHGIKTDNTWPKW